MNVLLRLFVWFLLLVYCFSNLLLIIPSNGYFLENLDLLVGNINSIKRTIDSTCILFHPNEIYFGVNDSVAHKNITSICTVIPYYYVHYCDYIKAIPPFLVQKAGFSHVMIIESDLSLKPSVNVGRVVKYMDKIKLSIATSHLSVENVQDYVTDILNNRVAIYTAAAWSCYYDLIDPKINNIGYGINKVVFNYCSKRIDNFRIGMLKELSYRDIKIPNVTKYVPKYAINMTPIQQRFEWLAVMKERRNETIDEGNPRLYGNNGYGLK